METRTRAKLGEVLTMTVDPDVPGDYLDSQFEEPDVFGSQAMKTRI